MVLTVRMLHAVVRDLGEGHLNIVAMGLVYTTLLALVPLLAFSFLVLKGVGVHNQIEPALAPALAHLGEKGAQLSQNIVGFVSLPVDRLPAARSLASTLVRAMEVWNESILPELPAGKTLLIAAHRNSLRALVKQLDGISDTDIVDLVIPAGVPLVYEFDDTLNVMARHKLSDESGHRAAA